MQEREYHIYIMTNQSKTLYVGITSDLERRVYERKNKLLDGFTKKYNMTKLIYYEIENDVFVAINREKQIKGWLRRKKIALIESVNPEWSDLSEQWFWDSSVALLPQNDKHSVNPGAKPKDLRITKT